VNRSKPLFAALLLVAAPPSADALTLPTNYGIGADSEVRESNPTQVRGNSTEIATRVQDGFSPFDGTGLDPADRNSVVYLQFDLAPWASGDVSGAVVRVTLRNNNVTSAQVHDEDGVSPDFGTNGLAYYGIYGASFDETTLNYDNAPGLAPDGDVGTLDF
jgi:hypothetical protein